LEFANSTDEKLWGGGTVTFRRFETFGRFKTRKGLFKKFQTLASLHAVNTDFAGLVEERKPTISSVPNYILAEEF
jgi:hypothetical protein